MRRTLVAQLFEACQAKLQLQHVCGDLDASISIGDANLWPADLVGHLNLIHPERLQVLGAAELDWARRQTHGKIAHHFGEILAAHPPAIVVADDCEVPAIVQDRCESSRTALFATPLPSASVIDQLRLYLSRQLSERISLHGVFMDVLGLGVLITGDSGTGKSELALELISRGHGLVADDVVELSRIAPTVLEGRAPEMLRDFIEVRGLGVLNVRTIFGETACRRKMRLKLVCHLERRQPGQGDPLRVPDVPSHEEILGIRIRSAVLPVAPGRNIAVLLEAAVRAIILQLRGIDSMQEFIARQRDALGRQDAD